jgi:cyclopropane-fatty-acyl-phospholipid synthase
MPTEALGSLSQGHAFEIVARGEDAQRWMSRGDAYSAGLAYVRGLIDVQGDLIEAVRYQLAHAGATWRRQWLDAACRWTPWRLMQGWPGRAATARNIRFHYDRSNEFYRQFLDSRLVYSCAYFKEPAGLQGEDSLDQAQLSKLDHICRKLRVQKGDRFLDIGCGWGALVLHAAQCYGATASGCTLSIHQAEYAAERARQERLAAASIHEMDYRDMTGEFDKIASVGMFEHVGRAHLETYFRKVYGLLTRDGLFLNHGITRPAGVPADAQSLFIARKVFPGSQLLHLDEVIRTAERVGFEVLDVENLRRHYALTCRAWVERLSAHRDTCLQAVDEETWRTWKLYLAGCTIAFEDGDLGLHQVLLSKKGASRPYPMTRDYMYN